MSGGGLPGERSGELGERLTHLREVRLQLGRPGEIGAGEVALQLPLAEPEEELRAGPLVDRLARGPRVELGLQRRELRVVPPSDEQPPGTGG